MRKNKKPRLISSIIVLAGLLYSKSVLAQFTKTVYGPPPPTTSEIIVRLLLLLSVILAPVFVILGIAVFFWRKNKKRNVEKTIQDRKS